MKFTMMNSAQPLHLERFRIVMVMSLYLGVAAMTWELYQQSSPNGLNGYTPDGVASYAIWVLLLVLMAPSGIGTSSFSIARQQFSCIVTGLFTLSTGVRMIPFVVSVTIRELSERLELFAFHAEPRRYGAGSLIYMLRYLSVQTITNFSRFRISTVFAKMILPVLEPSNLLKEIRMKPLCTGVTTQLSLLVWRRASRVPVSFCIPVGHSSNCIEVRCLSQGEYCYAW